MKNVLITGEHSYVGNSFAEWVKNDSEINIEKVSLRDGKWREKDFSKADVVLHVAGIAHVSTDPKQEQLYYEVNRDLTIEIAIKAKRAGIKQFIFMSSIIVYGDNINGGVITEDTIPDPANFYGKSKLEAEKGIVPLQSDQYDVVIVRPPMIYGKNSKGNYPKLAKLAKKSPFFPDIDNKRSMLHIDNLSEFIKLLIYNQEKGYFFPQNKEYVKTSEMVKMIASVHGKNIRLVNGFNPFIKPLVSKINILNKVFGNLYYKENITALGNYQVNDLEKSIAETESRNKNI
ncbi:NAD-dependent epimerase/dehydratase family protein [Alkalicoccobacillus porphyridii]|uniref:NAD-dependent epimerase/dehydratase family protein n=1 Tax=Alkalicoccobacillus porphyridii TaxID=2597270 RepID=A0A554A4G9_9BACI|nr:NAD-dependent epimerase/dehydratase family protein [Alkalicoccobacillus porphyridii]TSB48572.1 NAD-dependent epimerase/dehydratase family protein [Alkalicoccobacillus porphyridii]